MKHVVKNYKIALPAIIVLILAMAAATLLIINSARFRVLVAMYDALNTELIENCLSAPLTADSGFVISSLKCDALPDDSFFSGAGLKLSAMADTEKQMLDMKLTPTFLIYAAPSVCIRQRNDVLGLSSPELYDKEFVFNSAHPFNGYEDSALREITGTDLPDCYKNISADLLKYPSEIKNTYSKRELQRKVLESEIKKTAGYAPLTTPDEHEYVCESYDIRFTTGATVTVYIDKAGKLRCMNYGCTTIYLCGSINVTDEFCLITDQYPLAAESIIPPGTQGANPPALQQLPDNMMLTVAVHGTSENYKQNRFSIGKEFTIDADTVEITLFSGNNEVLYINGNATFALSQDDTPICEDLPDEDLYSMSQSDIQNAMREIYGNLQNNQLTKLIITASDSPEN